MAWTESLSCEGVCREASECAKTWCMCVHGEPTPQVRSPACGLPSPSSGSALVPYEESESESSAAGRTCPKCVSTVSEVSALERPPTKTCERRL